MDNDSIDVVDFMKARSKEIEAIERSIETSHKKSLLWQRIPFYRRRRNRNYDKRSKKKFSYRKKDRHFLRTHTFYAKRFFMLKLNAFSIPLARRLKSSKYMYKSQHRGFIFDESFRGAHACAKSDLAQAVARGIDLAKDGVIQYIDNEYEVIVDGDRIISIGKNLCGGAGMEGQAVVSVILKKDYRFEELDASLSATIYKPSGMGNGLETHKILCPRTSVMSVYQKLQSSGFIAVCLDEIHRLALERDCMTVYDNVHSPLFKEIEAAQNAEKIAKYERTPASKKQAYDLGRLHLHDEPVHGYFIFQITKGSCEGRAEILSGGECIGRVIRGGYKFSSGRCHGLGFCYNQQAQGPYHVRNLGQKNSYEMEIIKYFD